MSVLTIPVHLRMSKYISPVEAFTMPHEQLLKHLLVAPPDLPTYGMAVIANFELTFDLNRLLSEGERQQIALQEELHRLEALYVEERQRLLASLADLQKEA